MMKQIAPILLALILLLSLCGCGAKEEAPAMQIAPAELTEEEEAIAKLRGLNAERVIFDFTVDDTMQSIQVNTYRLVDGQWELKAGGGGWNKTASNGRLALGMEKIPEGLRVALQCGEDYNITSYGAPEETLPAGWATTFLSEPVDIVYDQEIPLVIQILSNKNQIVSYGVDYFFQPEEYEKFDYEAVWAVTIRFRQQRAS